MPNPLRGEIEARLGDCTHTLCLTLSAIAELEHRLGVDSMAALLSRFQGSTIRAADLLLLLVSGLKGYNPAICDDDAHVLLQQTKPASLIKIAADLVEATFGESDPARPFEQG
jgi:Phage tail tube protein, GTA-gp10